MRLALTLWCLLLSYSISHAQSAREAIDFVNGKSNSGVHSAFNSPDEAQEYSEIRYDGLIIHKIKLFKDRETKEGYKSPRIFEATSLLKYMNPFDIKVISYGNDVFYLELNTTNGTYKVKVNNYGELIGARSIRLGPYRRSDEGNMEQRLLKALAVAITHFGGKPDSF